MSLAPVVLFVYNRPSHTRMTLEALSKNILADQSELYIYADGPKKNAMPEQIERINSVRKVIREKKWCKDVQIIERTDNIGLGNSIVEGITEILKRNERAIVLEDDLITSVGFLKYMNEALDLYQKEVKVMHVSGYIYPVKKKLPETFFYTAATCWGWGTWKRAWEKFNNNREDLIDQVNRKGVEKFNLDNGYNFYQLLLSNSSSWAVQWYSSMFIQEGLALHPGKSLVSNIGNDGSGTHPFNSKVYDTKELIPSVKVSKRKVSEDANARQIIVDYFKNISKIPLYKRIVSSIIYRTSILLKKKQKREPIAWENFRSLNPVSRKFGLDRGQSIDRYYIEKFLIKNAKNIKGNVLEVSESTYTKKLGHNLTKTDIITAAATALNPQNRIIADLTNFDSLPQSAYDCFICTQTLNFIYDFKRAIQGAHQVLKKDGVLIATVAGVCQISRYDADRWGDYWRFTPMSIEKVFSEVFGEANITVDYYGNSLSAISLLKGLASEELNKEELDFKDADYPVVITIVALKK